MEDHRAVLVDELADKQAIHEVVLAYCRGIDRRDLDLVRSCYHPDAVDHHGPFEGSRDEYLSWVGRVLARFTTTMHVVANHLVELDGDRAGAETYGVAYHFGDPADDPRRNFATGFRYADRFERRGDEGGWRIAERFAIGEWTLALPAAVQLPVPEGELRGRHDHHDPIYRLLGPRSPPG